MVLQDSIEYKIVVVVGSVLSLFEVGNRIMSIYANSFILQRQSGNDLIVSEDGFQQQTARVLARMTLSALPQ